MTPSFDVVIIGGGIIGAATAAALAELDIKTLLVDRGCVGGEGASRYSGGIVRLYDPDERIMRLAAYSYARMEDTRCGRAFSSTLVRNGVFYVLEREPQRCGPDLEAAGGRSARRLRLLSRREAVAVGASIRPDGPGLVIWEADGGYGDVRHSARVLMGQMRCTATVLENATARIEHASEDRSVVRIGSSRIEARRIVIAAGTASAEFVPELGLRVRSIPLVRMHAGRAVVSPVIDTLSNSYIVPVGRSAIQVGSRVRSEGDRAEDLAFDEDAIIADACRRLEAMAGGIDFGPPIDIVRGFDAYVEDGPALAHLPDRHLHAAVGFSGIGYKLSIGAGWLMARRIAASLTGKHGLSSQERSLLDDFDPSRRSGAGNHARTTVQ